MLDSASFTRVCLSFALLASACSSSSTAVTIPGGDSGVPATGGAGSGAGGALGSGGGTSSGGSLASGGQTSPGGGVSSGGATSSGGAGVGGAGGSVDGGTPAGDGAAPPASCRTNADCARVAGKPLCEAASGECIACHSNAQCSAKEECSSSVCTKLPTCQNSLDCASAPGKKTICDKGNGVCVQCTATADCGTGKVCSGRVCLDSCSSDNDCSAQQMLCNKGLGFTGQCTQCIISSDCGAGDYCESGTCVPQTCKPAQQSCDGELVVQCNDTGSGVTPLTQCTLALFSSCLVSGDNARCVGACDNLRKDALESDVDCGGPTCQRCVAGKKCVLPTDCASNKCTSSKCE